MLRDQPFKTGQKPSRAVKLGQTFWLHEEACQVGPESDADRKRQLEQLPTLNAFFFFLFFFRLEPPSCLR